MKTVDRCLVVKITRSRESVAIPAGFSKYSVRLGSALPTTLSTQDFFFLLSISKLLLSSWRNFTRGLSGGRGQTSCGLAGGTTGAFSLPANPSSSGNEPAITINFRRRVEIELARMMVLSSTCFLACFAASVVTRQAALSASVVLSAVVLQGRQRAFAPGPCCCHRSPYGRHRRRPSFCPCIPWCAPTWSGPRHGSHGM